MDDMIAMSKDLVEHTLHLKETFELLRKYKMKLNLEKLYLVDWENSQSLY